MTFKLSVVDMQFGMSQHVCLEGKGSATYVTSEGFEPRVNELVLFEMVFLEELVPTLTADMGTYILVPSHVISQLKRESKLSTTILAGEFWFQWSTFLLCRFLGTHLMKVLLARGELLVEGLGSGGLEPECLHGFRLENCCFACIRMDKLRLEELCWQETIVMGCLI